MRLWPAWPTTTRTLYRLNNMGIPYRFDPLGTLGASPFPPGYHAVESVYFDKNTWFDTGVVVDTTNSFRCVVEFEYQSNYTSNIIGNEDNSLLFSERYGYACRRAGSNMPSNLRIIAPKKRYTFESIYTTTGCQLFIKDDEGAVKSTTWNESGSAGGVAAYLGARNGAERNPAACRLWSAEILDASGETIAMILPCADAAGNLCFYDVLRKTFLTKLAGELQP